MFVGSIPQELRQIVHEHTAGWKVDDVWVGCSGNLTVERVLDGKFNLHSNDVSLYTSVVANWLASQPMRLEVKDERFEWVEPYLDTPERKVASILLSTRMLENLNRGAAYYVRQRRAYRDQWDDLFERTLTKLEKVSLRLASYQAMDVGAYLDALPQEAAVVSFPPFYVGGYEQLYKGIEEVFDWDEPDYPVLDRQGLHAVLAKMREKRHWFYATDHRVEGREADLRGVLEKRGNVPIYVYSSEGHKRVVGIHHETSPVTNPRLSLNDEIQGPLALAPIDAKQYGSLRAHYLAPNILGAAPTVQYAVMDQGKIVGVIAFKREDAKVGRGDLYLVADFCVAPTQYKRLSKLIVMVALSTEVRQLLERKFGRVRTVVTSAFTDRPVSMKYRSVMELVSRDEKGGQGKNYKLVYRSNLGRWTLDEALHEWRVKHERVKTLAVA